MKQRLIKEMYNYNSKPVSNLFGLWGGQCHHRSIRVVKNAGWYNKYGEKLGSGDLSKMDFLRISKELKSDELFIILLEREASLRFIRPFRFDIKKNKLKIEAPGVDYVVENCCYIIAKRLLYFVDQYSVLKDSVFKNTYKYYELKFKVLSRKVAKQLIVS